MVSYEFGVLAMAAKGSTGLFVSYTKFRIGPLAAMGSLNCLMTGIGRIQPVATLKITFLVWLDV